MAKETRIRITRPLTMRFMQAKRRLKLVSRLSTISRLYRHRPISMAPPMTKHTRERSSMGVAMANRVGSSASTMGQNWG